MERSAASRVTQGKEPSQRRGVTVILWRAGGLGYALVAEVDPAVLTEIAARFSPGV